MFFFRLIGNNFAKIKVSILVLKITVFAIYVTANKLNAILFASVRAEPRRTADVNTSRTSRIVAKSGKFNDSHYFVTPYSRAARIAGVRDERVLKSGRAREILMQPRSGA